MTEGKVLHLDVTTEDKAPEKPLSDEQREVMQKNWENQQRLAAERKRNNDNIVRNYRLRGKK